MAFLKYKIVYVEQKRLKNITAVNQFFLGKRTMRMFLVLSPIQYNPIILFMAVLPLLSRISFISSIVPIFALIMATVYSIFMLLARRRVGRAYFLALGWMVLLNVLDVATTWVGASFSAEGIHAVERNSAVRALFPEGSEVLGLSALSMLKIAFSLSILEPLYTFEMEILNKKRRFSLLSQKQCRAERKGFNTYIALHVGRWRESIFAGHGIYMAEFDDAYLDHAGSVLLRNIVSGIVMLSICFIGILLNNLSVLLFTSATMLGYVWLIGTVCTLIVYCLFVQEKLVEKIYGRIIRK